MNLTWTWIHLGAIAVGIAMLLVLLKIDMGRRSRGIFFFVCGVSALVAAFAVWMDLGGLTPLLPTAYVIAAVSLFGTGTWLSLRPPSAMSAYERQTLRRGARIVVVPVEDQSWSSCCWLTGEPTEHRQELLLRRVSLWPLLLAFAGVVAIGSSQVRLVIPLSRPLRMTSWQFLRLALIPGAILTLFFLVAAMPNEWRTITRQMTLLGAALVLVITVIGLSILCYRKQPIRLRSYHEETGLARIRLPTPEIAARIQQELDDHIRQMKAGSVADRPEQPADICKR